MAVSVVVVDDHEGFRAELRALLEANDFDVVGEAADGANALVQAAKHRPDVVLLDIGLPDISGVDLVAPLRAASPASRVILLSGRHASDFGDRVARAGADGFVEKAHLGPRTVFEVLNNKSAK
jgi:DNA-binding NarL/FixJ family response regulator